jgi:hypothetical protein
MNFEPKINSFFIGQPSERLYDSANDRLQQRTTYDQTQYQFNAKSARALVCGKPGAYLG